MPGTPHFRPVQACYFVTTVTFGRRRLFISEQPCQLLCNLIYKMRERGKYLLAGFVVMPDHVHLAILPVAATVPEIMRDFKKGSARLVNMNSGESGAVWQSDYWDRIVESEDELMQKLRYMLANPYRAGLLSGDETYRWGSGNKAFETDLSRILGL